MTLRNVSIIWWKELRDISRDRRALLFMIALPIAIVPLLMALMGGLIAFGQKKLLEEPGRVGILNAGASSKIVGAVRAYSGVGGLDEVPPELVSGLMASSSTARAGGGAAGGGDESGRTLARLSRAIGTEIDLAKVSLLRIVTAPADIEEARARIKSHDLELAIVIPDGCDEDLARERPVTIRVVYDSSFDKSRVAFRHLSAIVTALERGIVLARLPAHGVEPALLRPIVVDESTVASAEQESRAILAHILPYLLILMCFSGAVYPAIDLGAGEKERGTLETLLVSPAERAEIVLGKFLVIVATALLAAALNLVSLWISTRTSRLSEIGARLSLSIDPGAALTSLALLLPIAATFAALLLAISVFAKSFKEAQAYFTPLNILIIVPAFFSAIPGVELDARLSLVPVVNVSLALKETLTGTYKWGCLALILGSTAALAAVSVAFSAWWFKRESVLFRS